MRKDIFKTNKITKSTRKTTSTVVAPTTQKNTTTGVYGDRVLAGVIRDRITSLLGKKGGEWVGSMSELDVALRSVVRTKLPANWPSSPSVMRRVVNSTVYSLRRSGVGVKFLRTPGYMRKRVVEFFQR